MSFCPQCQMISPLVIMGACLEAANRFYKCSTCWMLSSQSVYLETANCNLQTTCYFDVVLVLKWCLEIWKGISPSCFSVCSYRQNQSVMLWKWLLWFDKHVERKKDWMFKTGMMIKDDGDSDDDDDNNSEGDDESNYRLWWWMRRKATVDISEWAVSKIE